MPRNAFSRIEELQDNLTRGEAMVIDLVRQALGKAIEDYSPDGANRPALAAVAVSGMFADLVGVLSTAPELVEVINRQLAACGFELVPTRRQ
jgi:hypothetical protein